MSEEDGRVKYLHRQVSQAFRNVSVDKFNEFWRGDTVARLIHDFLDNPENQSIFFKESKGTIEALDSPQFLGKGQVFYLVKLHKTQVSEGKIAEEIVYGDIVSNPLEHLASLSQRIFFPIVGSKKSVEAWSETVAKDVRDSFETFVSNVQITQGHVKGYTCLPLPNTGNSKAENAKDDNQSDLYSQIHALEGALITWTKQIKNVLKNDSESLFQSAVDPSPLNEIDFWKTKASNLNSIFDQLQSPMIRRVLKVLDKSKSTYNAPFAKLCKEVFHARAEANNIVKYLKPLHTWFDALERETDFENLVNHFPPIIHQILLVWKSSAYYNTASRLVIIMREISNTLIRQASTFLNGDEIFQLIETGETASCIKMLKTVLQVFGKFKTKYFEYKIRASVDCPDNPWSVQNNAVFIRLDNYLERCHDILDLAQTITMFSKLSKIEIGGTKGKTLTTSVVQIYSDFNQSVDIIRSVGAGILDLSNKKFDDAFYEFRTRMKELDRRLGSVILQGFEDASTVIGRFRLLDSFDNLITRPIVSDALEKKHFALVEAIRIDLELVQNIFNEYRDKPLIASNLPPIAGALTWSKSLRDRIDLPIEKLKTLDKKILEREDTREVIKMYTSLIGQLDDLDRENIERWGEGIEDASQSKLKNPLIRRELVSIDPQDKSNVHSLIFVNFDPILVKLLREVKYFLLLGLEVPASATEVYQRAEIFRRQTGNLDLIVNMYNDIQTTLLPVERPLVRALLDRIDKTLSQGIGEGKNKAKALNWKSNGIDLFIAEAMTEVKEVNEMLQMLKGNLKKVEQTVSIWRTLPIFDRGYKTVSTVEFINLQKKTRQAKLQTVKEEGQEIHRVLKETNKKLKVSQGLPDWKAYVDFVNNVVVFGLSDAMSSSLKAMAAQFNPKYLEANSLPALIEIQLDLINQRVCFIPEVGFVEGEGVDRETGIMNISFGWINGMLGLSSAFKRLDTSEGTYLRELCEAPDVLMQKSRVVKFLTATEKNANKLRNVFRKFEYLWLTNINELFKEFLSEVVQVESVPFVLTEQGGANTTDSANPQPNGNETNHGFWLKTTINLEKFGERIKSYLEIQLEVSEIRTIHDIDFIRVNAQPIKQAISTWVTKWLYMHTQYLQSYVGDRLTDLFNFLQHVNKGLDIAVVPGDRDALMTVMKHIHDVRKRMPEIASLFEPINKIVGLLKINTIPFDLPPIGGQAALDFMEHAKMLWENTVNKTFRVKENIQPLQTNMLEGVRKDVKGFNEKIAKFVKDFRAGGPFTWLESDLIKREAYQSLDSWQKQLVQLVQSAKAINDLEDLFELSISTHSSIAEVEQDLRALKNVWDSVVLVESLFTTWKNTLWQEIKTDELLDEVKRLQNQLKKQTKKSREWGVFKRLEQEVKNMVITLPLVHDLHSPAIRERHWKSLMTITGVMIDRGPSFCLDNLLSLNLQFHVDAVSDIVEVANKEVKIENRLLLIEDAWRKFSLKFDQHRDTDMFIVAPPDDILEALEEHSLHLQSMAGMGKFVDFFREQVTFWQLSLGEVETTLKLLLMVERQWESLESIFLGSADIRAQLPDDTKRFEAVDVEFKEQMRDIQARSGVMQCCRAEGREQSLRNMHKELEKCEKALNEYLEIKKGYFPRFYFVSNAALLDILSNGNCPPKIMPHIGSVFDGIGDLDLCPSASQAKALKDEPESIQGPLEAAKAMISKDREIVPFPMIFEMKGAVENWLNELVKFMQLTLRGVLNNSMTDATAWDLDKPREDWVFTVPAQIALVTSQVIWTEEVESALEELESGQEDALKKYNEICNSRLESLIRLVQLDLSKGDRIKIITVITIDVHNRDVVGALVQKKVESNLDFKWQSQLRYYWVRDDRNVNIRICDFATQYSFEYVGNCGRLVITPLTDRCYVTLTVALRLMLGGAPAGPAGTGKTETTKDLSRGLGLACYVFNCSDQMNYQTMADIFKGLTQVGAWGCFDEFNRIEIEVLSVVATQVRCILDAIMFLSIPANRPAAFQALPAGTPPVKIGTFNFFGEQIALIPTVGLFITMNPGYAGRTELPENLKALFRSCAMIQPDFLPISENMLMAEGFVKARPLSVKFVTLYKLSSELLSKQHHYDWGLRAIKSVLRVAGMLKRADPQFEEEAILMRALRDFNTPKIPSNDIPIFLRLISDLFPSLDLAPKVNEGLFKVCEDVCKTNGLCPEELFISKVMQFQELLDVRHSVMLLGPAGCGKTTVWKTLAAAHSHGKSKPVTLYETVNPKSVTTDELYGYMTLTKDWRDGVLSIIMRNMCKNHLPYQASQTGKWVVLDGDIDAVWIESMNTVMDDNKVLTLVSNERIPLSDSMRMVFEIHTLKNATPATVSRAGILYINDTDVGYQPYVDSWLSARTNELEKSYLPYLVNRYLGKVMEFLVASKLEMIVPLPTINLVQSFCFLLDGMLKPPTADQQVMERIFLFCLMWAFGGALPSDRQIDYKKLFSNFFKTLSKAVKFPESGTVLDYWIDPNSGETISWQNKVEGFSSSGDNNSTIVVPTADTVRLTYLMNNLFRNGRPVMFVGSAGTGKTVLVSDSLSSLSSSEETYKSVNINMNFYTDSAALQQQLEQNIDKRSGKNYGPPSGKLIYFVDDLNLPFVETYGTQTPIALMRQHIDHGSWYDRSDLSLKKQIFDTQYVTCMNHKSGSFLVDPRLQRHFVTFACMMPSEQDLATIFGTILNGHLFHFDKKIQNMKKNLTDATITLHKEISTKFLPSAVKFHYNFTMRDLSAIFKGLLNSRPAEQNTTFKMTRLWYHEVMRVFSDKLISDIEVLRCRDVVINVGKRFMEEDPELVYADPCTFTNFVPNAGSVSDELTNYRVCDDFSKLKVELERKLSDYNETNAIMNLVLFEQAIRHVTRIARILMFPGGNALLVGVGGSGKQSLSKLAAFICKYETYQISVTSDYSVNDLKEHLKDMYKKAGVKPGEPLVFLLTDSQITDERFLVYINDLLSSGRIPDLFTKEDYDGIFNSLRNIAKSEGVPDNRDSMMNFFINRVRANLHMILCFSPVGDAFRQRARKFPGIINCTAIDWFHEWPKEALVSVAQRFLENVETGGKPEVRDNIAYHIAEVHSSVGTASREYLKKEKRINYTTPKSFLELISFYKSLLKNRRDDMFANIKRLDIGLDTLMRTNKSVEELQESLIEKKKEVEAKKAATDKLLEEMGKQRSEAEAQQAVADIEKTKADGMAEEARKLEEQAAGDLAIAKPAMDAANDAVNCLDKNSLTELKSFSKPPSGVDKVTTALLIMIKAEKKDFSWENAKKMMAKVDAFKEKLETYRGEDIPEDVISRVSPMLEDPEFTFEKMKTKSAAAANLANWVINIIRFNGIYKRVKPLMESLEVATKSKRKAEDDLGVVKEKLAVIEGKLAKLQSEFMAATQEKAKVEQEAADCMNRLGLAERLTNGLASEKDRWSLTVEGLRAREVTIAGDVMLAAAFTSYIGAFGATFRLNLWKDVWLQDLVSRDIPLTPNIDPLWVLTSDSQTAVWQNEGLPADRISLENGAIISNCNRWPLLIDPQLQGIRWLKTHEEIRTKKNDRQLVIMRPGGKQWMTRITNAISAGDTVILENIDETLDASLDSVLTKAVYRKGKTMYLKVGDEEVEYDDQFRLYLQTKLSNPHYKPEISAQCTIINFIVTRKGLEDQLLATIVSEEEPALEQTRNELVQSFNTYKIQLKELEDLLLERLSNAPPDILSDIPLIEGLEATKQTATEINDAVIKAQQTEIGINQAREVYRLVATEASLLYFVLLQLNNVDHMYQYSLDSFTMFFLKALKTAVQSESKPERVLNLQSTLRWTIFKWVVRGLFEKHRLIFLTQLTLTLLQNNIIGEESGFTNDGLRFLLLNTARVNEEKSPISWVTDIMWNGIRALAMIDGFEKLPGDMEENSPRFLEWFQHFTPESEKLPGSWRELDKMPFKKLLVVRILRPDRITVALTNFIRDALPKGKDYVECDSEFNSFQILESSFSDSSPIIPLYFILSPGADVVKDVDLLAVKMNKVKGVDYHNISLGQGQDKVASEKLEVGNRQGHWVFLNNVHLMPRFLTTIEKKLEEYALVGTHPDFRIMFSSDPSNSIPVSILDRCIKITSDPPSGLKANLKQAFACFSRETYEELESRTKGILFGLCQFHAVMVERKKFGSKGYNMMYPFSIGDLVCSAAVLRNYMESAPAKVPWADLRYLFGEIMYGGHIVNDFDRLLANTYLDFYMKEELLFEMPLYPHLDATVVTEIFKAPATSLSYEKVLEHIDEDLRTETPLAFGLHPNAEIGFRTNTSEDLLRVILELSSSSNLDGSSSDGQDNQQIAEAVIQDVLESLRDVKYEIDAIASGLDDIGPFQNVILQECERMNSLASEIVRSLIELDMGFKGDLTISDAMEDLANALYLDRVPKRWELLAYPSLRSLGAWLVDLQTRISQLNDWVASPLDIPVVTWISGLFNPPSFLTSIMQITAQSQGLELDKLTLVTDVQKRLNPEEFSAPAKDGTYISGLYLEGASWNLNAALLEPSKPREMFCQIPVINIRPTIIDKFDNNTFLCPVYKTQQRGPTYVFSLQLKTKLDAGKWILAGVVSIMDIM
eukprot:gene5405-7492_t